VLTGVNNGGPSVLVGPITLPAYLDRTQVVSLAGNHELVVDEFTRWAEPLQDTFYRVLIEDLSSLLNTPEVYGFDSRGSTPTDFQVIIDVTRFDSVGQRDAHLTAFWTVLDQDGKTHLIERKSAFHASSQSRGLTGVIDAQNKTLTEFSREIAAAIRSLHR
jgi:uncharacterized lipoprotein YmbA